MDQRLRIAIIIVAILVVIGAVLGILGALGILTPKAPTPPTPPSPPAPSAPVYLACPSGYQIDSTNPTNCVITTCPNGQASNNGLCQRTSSTLATYPAICNPGTTYVPSLGLCSPPCNAPNQVMFVAAQDPAIITSFTNNGLTATPGSINTLSGTVLNTPNGSSYLYTGDAASFASLAANLNLDPNMPVFLVTMWTCYTIPPGATVTPMVGVDYYRETPNCYEGSTNVAGTCYARCPAGTKNVGNDYLTCYGDFTQAPLNASRSNLKQYTLSQPRPMS